ncbi:MAG: 30S ribosomal protein S21, partial [Pseudanabaena sp.]
MTQIIVGENEGIESALRRFKKKIQKAGLLADIRRCQ